MSLHGLRVGVTAGRKGAELVAALERRGARPTWGRTVGGDQPEPDEAIMAQTEAVLSAGPRWLAASTGVGMRLWAEVAERHGCLEDLRAVVHDARRVARGPKAVGGMQAVFDVRPEWVADLETDSEVAEHLLAVADTGDTVAVQLHGGPSRAYDALERAGLEVLPVLPYRSVLPDEAGPALTLVQRILDGEIDLLVFTSPGAAHNLLILARDLGPDVPARVREQVAAEVAVAAVGPVTAGACRQIGLGVTITPRRFRTGELLREIDRWTEHAGLAPEAQPRR